MISGKKLAVSLLALLLAGSTQLFAFEPQTATLHERDTLAPPNVVQRRTRLRHKRLGSGLRQLNLSVEQRQQMQAILQRHLESTRAQREELFRLREKRITETLTAEDQARARGLHEQLRGMRQSIRNEFGTVLTAEQRTQLEQLESQRQIKREEKRKRRQEFRNRIPQ